MTPHMVPIMVPFPTLFWMAQATMQRQQVQPGYGTKRTHRQSRDRANKKSVKRLTKDLGMPEEAGAAPAMRSHATHSSRQRQPQAGRETHAQRAPMEPARHAQQES